MRPSGEALALAGSCTWTGEVEPRHGHCALDGFDPGSFLPLIAHQNKNRLELERALPDLATPAINLACGKPNRLCRKRAAVTLDFALAQSDNRPWTELSMRLGQRVIEIVTVKARHRAAECAFSS